MTQSSLTQDALTVSQLTSKIKNTLEPAFTNITLQGEVSNFKQQSSGHLYFSLKDSNSQISAVMFYGHASKLRKLPKSGDQVVVKGDISVYAPRGNYQIVVRELSPVGLGELLLKLEQLKIEIHRRGWFSKDHKKPLPHMPKKVGIVTSPTGAAFQDMLKVLNRRFAGLHIILNPVKVQGEGSAEEIASAIQQMNDHSLVDVIIAGRGGGSIEDLWAFNEEVVASAIFHSKIPVICAVGHETDHTIAEYVADVRAPTPSAAAELVIAEKEQLQKHVLQCEQQLIQNLKNIIRHGKHQIESIIRQPALASPYYLLGNWMQKVDDLKDQMNRAARQYHQQKKLQLEGIRRQLEALNPITQIIHYQQKFSSLEKAIFQAEKHHLLVLRQKLRSITETMEAIDPKNLLKRGYSILFDEKDGSVITSVKSMQKQQKVRMLVSDGQALAHVDEVIEGEESRDEKIQ
ncbi:MAG: Exodeoxyribonuclease 7 large subunit [Chlamydiae bacterium]|nr:Exodeoxyribonuclease 7 large subunit [Chlamydiota bacterium]